MKFWVPVIKFKQVELGHRRSTRDSENPDHTEPKNYKRIYISIGAMATCLLIGFFIWHNLNSPNYGHVAISNQGTSSVPKVAEFTTLNTNYYSLDYSQSYIQQPTDINPAGVLDYKVLAYQPVGQSGQNKIEVSIKAAPDGGITLDSVYDYYAKHPNSYKLSNQLTRGEIIDIARSIKGSPETAGMWLHGDYLMIIKITTPDAHFDISGQLKNLLSSVQWSQ